MKFSLKNLIFVVTIAALLCGVFAFAYERVNDARKLAHQARLESETAFEYSAKMRSRLAEATLDKTLSEAKLAQAEDRMAEYRLRLFFDSARFQVVESESIREENGKIVRDETRRGSLRFVRLKDNISGLELIVIMNPLEGDSAPLDNQPAEALRAWARTQSAPIIAIGNSDAGDPDSRYPDALLDFHFGAPSSTKPSD